MVFERVGSTVGAGEFRCGFRGFGGAGEFRWFPRFSCGPVERYPVIE